MIRLRAIGECLIEVGGERVGPDAELAFALLLVLVVERGRPLTRRQLVDLLWPASTEARARHNLRQTLYKLRQLGVPAATESNRVRLPAAAVAVDPLLDAGDAGMDGPPPAELLRPDLPFGEFLAGYAPTFSAPFAAWVEEQRGVMHARLRRVVLATLLDERRRGSWGAVETLARKCLQLDPLNEEATLALAEATALTGSKHAALAILDGYLHEVGHASGDLRIPATVLRRRIAERLPHGASPALADTCFVGRESSVAFLYEHFRAATEAGGRAVLVWGEAGIGKSRLLTEFGRMATLEGAQVVRVGCQERDIERPLSAFVDAVPLLLAVPGALGCSPSSMGYLRRLTEHDPTVLEPGTVTREAELLFACVRRAIFDLVDAVAAEAPLVLCIEDVHWLDEPSWRVLRELIGWLADRQILVVLTSRLPHATPTPPTRPAPGVVAHRLPALDTEAASELLAAVTAAVPPPTAYREWCLQVGEGNPLFIRAAGTHWLETRELRAPPSIQQLVRERVGKLGPDALRLLQACAILGSCSTFDRLLRILDCDAKKLLAWLAEIEDRGLLTTSATSVHCRHSIVAEAALESLTPGTRLLMHRCAAMALERDAALAHSVALLWACKQHWEAAGEGARATALVRSCTAHMLAIGLPELAVEACDALLSECTDAVDRLRVLEDLALALRMCGRWGRLLAVIADIEQLRKGLSRDNDGHTEHELIALEASLLLGERLPSLLARAEQCARSLNAPANHRIQAAAMALYVAENMFDRSAMERVYRAIEPLNKRSATDRRTMLRAAAIFHNSIGDPDEAVGAIEAWIELERDANDPISLSRALRNATIPYRTAGLMQRAFAVALESYELAAEYRMASSAAHSADVLAHMNLSVGDLDGGRMWLGRGLSWAATVDEPLACLSLRYLRARLMLLEGDQAAARKELSPEMAGAWRSQMPRSQIESFSLLSLALVEHGELDQLQRFAACFLELYLTARHFYGQDLATTAVVTLLSTLGQEAVACQLLDAYVGGVRRERAPFSTELQRLLSRRAGPRQG